MKKSRTSDQPVDGELQGNHLRSQFERMMMCLVFFAGNIYVGNHWFKQQMQGFPVDFTINHCWDWRFRVPKNDEEPTLVPPKNNASQAL